MSSAFVLASLFAQLSATVPATAAPPEKHVQFLVPVECGGRDEFFLTLETEHQITQEMLNFRALVLERVGGQYQLEWTDAQGVRRLNDIDCRTLFRAAVVIAVSSVNDPQAVDAGDTPATAEPVDEESIVPPAPTETATAQEVAPPAPPVDPAPAPPVDPAPAPPVDPALADSGSFAPAERIKLAFEVSGDVGVHLGLYPGPGFVTGLEAALFVGKLGLALGGSYAPPQTSLLAPDVGIRLESWLLSAQVAVRPFDWLRLDLGLLAASLTGLSRGISDPERATVWLLGPKLDILGRLWSFRSGFLELGASSWVSANTPRFEIDPEGEIYRVARVGGGLFFRGTLSTR